MLPSVPGKNENCGVRSVSIWIFLQFLANAKSSFCDGGSGHCVNMILSVTISPDISKKNSANGSVRFNPWESQTSLFQFKNDEYAGAGVL